MTVPSSNFQGICRVSALLLLAGCASPFGAAGSTDYATKSCADLNVAIGNTSKSISSVAISRGKVDRLSIPFWAPGGERAVSALHARRTRKIGKLESDLAAMRSERASRCR
jgi:hypothetical protein